MRESIVKILVFVIKLNVEGLVEHSVEGVKTLKKELKKELINIFIRI